MKLRLLLKAWVLLLIFAASACRNMPSGNEGAIAVANPEPNEIVAQPTTVYLVRHAEKDISNPSDQDPGLTEAGVARAEALRSLLEGQKIGALYATKYKRTKDTLLPLAQARKLDVIEYDAHDFNGLESKILQEHKGEVVVVAGHSNTLLPLVEAFGARRPVPDIAERQYDYIFKVIVAPDGTATVEAENFGAKTE
ncbi:SixA phosphatase family protein [Pontibacter sp. MBLB2868]|uniref:SixA phosphatase family protein n=1 Tax=Pontibacter sp. MBLB2868 TaxID=3451555 RepID=UPI003F74B88A